MTQIAGTWLMVELLEYCRSIPGGIAECGVYQGGNAFVVLNTCDLARQRPYHLLDSFAGFDELSDRDPRQRAADFRGVSSGQVRDVFTGFRNVNIHKGSSRRRCQKWKSVSTALSIWTPTYIGLRRNCRSISGVEYLPGVAS